MHIELVWFIQIYKSINLHFKYIYFFFSYFFFLFSFTDGANFKCPKEFGSFEDSIQCDKYYECNEGIAVEKLCPDGLVFDPQIRKINKCDQPFNVDCGDRIELRQYNNYLYIFLIYIPAFLVLSTLC